MQRRIGRLRGDSACRQIVSRPRVGEAEAFGVDLEQAVKFRLVRIADLDLVGNPPQEGLVDQVDGSRFVEKMINCSKGTWNFLPVARVR